MTLGEAGAEGLGFAKFTRRKTLFNSAKGYVALKVVSFSYSIINFQSRKDF